MLPDCLVPEKSVIATDSAELQGFLGHDFSVSYIAALLCEIILLPEGAIRVFDQVIPCTQHFLEKVAFAIGMPKTYAYNIDFGLFAANFEAQKRIRDLSVSICIVDGRAVGLARGKYRPARTADVLDALFAAGKAVGHVQKSVLSDAGAEIDFLRDSHVIEPKPGDVIRTGFRVWNSETGQGGLKASFFAYRLKCRNGAVFRDSVGTVRWPYDPRVTYTSSIRGFVEKLVELSEKQDRLKDIYARAIHQPVEEEQLARLWRRIRNAGGLTPERTDLILGITESERRALVASVLQRREANQPASPAEWDLYEIHNRITAAAQSLPFGARSRLERIGGEVLSYRLSK
jgi:hypothetical protein